MLSLNRHLCAVLVTGTTFTLLFASPALAVNLSNLDPMNALFVGDEDSLSATAGGPGTNGLALGASTNTANGFTYNITFSPDPADLSGLVLLMEIGGTTNGVGLYLIDGVPTLALKTGAAGTAPASETLSDLDFSDGAASIFSSYGPVTAGNSISVATTWGTNNLFSLAVQDDTDMYSTLDAVTITGQSDTDYNWLGNGTFNVGDDLQPNLGSRGGLTDGTTTIWLRDNMVNLTADLAPDSAIYWNDRATLAVDFGPPPPPLVPTVRINRDTGNVTFENLSDTAINLIGYTIETSNGAFDTTAWNKVDDLDTNDTWEQLTAPGNPSLDISEATLGAGYTVDATGGAHDSINLGDVWIKSPFEDITLDFRNDAGESVVVNVVFEGNGDEPFMLGDFNFANGIDAADWAILRSHLISDPAEQGLLAYGLGDINVDGLINEADFDQFKSAFDTANGPGAFAAMIAGGIPEPSSLALFALAGVVASTRRLRASLNILFVAVLCGAGPNLAYGQTNLYSDTFDRAAAQEDDIDASVTGMSGTAAPASPTAFLVENGDDTLVPAGALPSPAGITNIENNQLHLADGNNASALYINHNFVEPAITTDGLLSIKLDVVSNDGTNTDNNRFVGFGVGATLAEFMGQTQLDAGATAAEPALRGNTTNNTGFADLWVGWSPVGGGTVQVVKNGALVQSIDDGVANAMDGEGDIQPSGTLGVPATLELRLGIADFNAGSAVPATIYYNGAAVGGDAIRWDNSAENYIGLTGRQSGEGYTVDNLAITTSTSALEVQTLSLEIHTDTGQAFLVGGSSDVTIDRYTISSANGLVNGSFNGIGGDAGLPLGDGSGNGWELGGVQSDSLLSEFFLGATGGGGSALGSGFMAPLGAIYNTAADTRDLLIEYHLTDGTVISGAATYMVSPGLQADFDGDNDVDGADFLAWQRGFGTIYDSTDLANWQAEYGNTASALAAHAVPEPTPLMLMAFGLGFVLESCRTRLFRNRY